MANKYVQQAFDVLIMGERRKQFYVRSLSLLIEWALFFGVKEVKFKNHFQSGKQKVFITFRNGRKFHTRYCEYYFFKPVWYFGLIMQKIRDNDYDNLNGIVDQFFKSMKKPRKRI